MPRLCVDRANPAAHCDANIVIGSCSVSRDLIDQLQENGRVAVETASVVTKLTTSSLLSKSQREHIRSAVLLRAKEVRELRDRLLLTHDDPGINRLIDRLEALWDDIGRRVEG